MAPTRTGKTGEHFPVREKLGNFAKTDEKSGNLTQNTGKSEKIMLENWKKYWKSQGSLSV